MLKKMLFVLLILTLAVVLFVPATALASGTEPQPGASGNTPQSTSAYEEKSIKDAEDAADDSPGETDGTISAASLSSVGPVKYTKSTIYYDPDEDCYWISYSYIAPKTGTYTFDCLNDFDTDIYIIRNGSEVAYDVSFESPFTLYAYLEKDKKYTILLIDREYYGSITYLMTTPATLGTAAYKVKSNGYAYNWYQAFDFKVTTESYRSFHVTCDSNEYSLCIYKDKDYAMEIREYGNNFLPEGFHTAQLDPGSYHAVLNLYADPTSYNFTIAMDGRIVDEEMAQGVVYTSTLSTNDMLTANYFSPESTGVYRLACSRSDAKITVIDSGTDNIIIQGAAPNTKVTLTEAETYYIYYVTNGTSGKMTYSATYLSPISTLSSLGFSAGDLSPDWGTEPTNEYTLLVDPDECSSLTFTPIPDASGGTMLINGTARSSLTIPVTAGMASQNVTIDYTSADENSTSTYRVFVRAKSVECSLTGLDSPFVFGANGRVATAMVDNETITLPVSPTVSDYATWELLGDDGETPLGSYSIGLAEGLNCAYIRVTSENGNHSRVYPLYVYRASDSTEPAILACDSEYKEVRSGIFTNLNLYVFALGTPDVSAVVTKDGNSADWSDPFTAEGNYEINAFSSNGFGAGPFQFTIDKTAPALTVVDGNGAAVASGALLKSTVTVSATDATDVKLTGTKDGTEYECPSDGVFTESGTYAVAAIDAAGNSTPYAFTIDVSAPNIRAVCGTNTLADGGHANGTVTVTVTDPHYKSKSVKKNGYAVSWPSGSKFTYAGVYDVTAYDTLGNKATFRFTIDKTKPVITAKYAGKYTLYSKGYTRYDVTVKVTETNLSTVVVTRNGDAIPWLSGTPLSEEGIYVFTATDLAGNTAAFTFTIDKTKPVIKALSGETELSTGANVNTNVTVSVSDTNLYGKYVKKNGYSIKWPSGGTFTSSGKYYVTAKDKAGNISTFSFVIDKVKPVISVKTTSGYTVYSGKTTKYDVYVKVSDSYLLSKAVTRNGEIIEWPSTNKFTVEGVYKVNATDKAGNAATEYTFTIYKPARFTVIEHFSGDPVVNNGYASEAVTISFYEPFYASKTLTKAGTTEPIPWPDDPKEITVSDEGVYTATVRDTYGSISVFKFTIDSTYPVIKVTTSSSATPMSDNFFTKASSVTVSVTDNYLASKIAAKDGRKISWPSYGRFMSEGKYVITAIDKAGNKSEFRFIIDRSKPVITCKTVTSQTKIANGATVSDSVIITITDRLSYSILLTKDEAEIDLPENSTVTEDGVYTITATDSLGYSNTFTFTIHKTV